MLRSLTLFSLLFFLTTDLFSQTYLRVTTVKLGRIKSYDVYINQPFEYKLKGDIVFRKNKIIAMSDSTLVFDNNEEWRFDQIKSIRMHIDNHLIEPFSFVFMVGGIAFFPLNTLNNWLIGTSPAFDEKALFISAALVTTSVLIKQLGIRRVRLNKKTDFKVLTIDFENLNVKSN